MQRGANIHSQIFLRDGYCFIEGRGRVHILAIICEHDMNDNRYRVYIQLEDGIFLLAGCFKSGKAASKRIDDIDWAIFANRVLFIPYNKLP